jgi:hypothetical protein
MRLGFRRYAGRSLTARATLNQGSKGWMISHLVQSWYGWRPPSRRPVVAGLGVFGFQILLAVILIWLRQVSQCVAKIRRLVYV